MERNIRDVRDIFGRSPGEQSQKPKQELRTYDYSPRSRRRHEAMESYDKRTPNHHQESRSNHSNKNNRHRSDDLTEPTNRQSKKTDENHTKNANSKNKDASYYANRTLTERDIRHLERHLSMKKTIRKQISRNLHQAFVDDPDLVLNDASSPVHKALNNSKASQDKSFTLTRAKVSKSEQNVLDLLKDKDNEPDSGHCSADNPNSSDDDTHHEKQTKSCNSRPIHDNRGKVDVSYKDDGKFSFWKMFSVKNRGKR